MKVFCFENPVPLDSWLNSLIFAEFIHIKKEQVGTATTAQEILPPVPEPVAHPEEDALVRVPEPNVTDIVEPLSQEQLRLARIFARLHVEDFRRARAAIYAEENRNFTAERAFLDVHGPVCTASAVFMHGGPGRDPPGDRFLVGGRGGAGRGPGELMVW